MATVVQTLPQPARPVTWIANSFKRNLHLTKGEPRW